MQSTEEFLRCMWPTEGNKVIVSIKAGSVKHFWFKKDEYKQAAEKALELTSEGFDVYYALAGFSGRQRKQEQVVALKSLWVDLDVGDDKDYKTRNDAVSALGIYLNQMSLPVPCIVSSGYGLHAYFILERDYTINEWQPIADALKESITTSGFKADLKCTGDAARILRPIGTLNFKNGTPRPVKLATNGGIHVDSTRVIRVLQQFIPQDIFQKIQQKAPKSSPTTTSFSTTVPADLDEILTKCATVRWGYEHQDEVAEPLWYDLLGITGYCIEPHNDSHRISELHPEYDETTTTRKYQQRIKAAGPTTCVQFQTNSQSKCKGCPHKITTPLNLGRPRNVVQVSHTPTVINGGARFAHGALKLDDEGYFVNMPMAKDKDGNQHYDWVKINKYGLCPLLELRQPDSAGNTSNYVWFEVYDHLGKATNSFITPSQGITNSMQFSGDCAKQGYYFESESATAAYRRFHKIMRTWVEEMKTQQGSIVTFKSFGWVGADAATAEKKNSFLLGNTLYTMGGGQHQTPVIPTLSAFQSDLVTKGSLDEWIKAMDNYNIPGMEAQMFATWIAWGSPLMCFTNSGTVVFHIIGETGVGKTSLQRSIISTYGDYNSKLLLDVNSSTMNSMGKTMGLLNSLPYCKEELTEADAKDLASWALTATQGREKQRMNQNNGIAQVSTWNMIACTSANQSLREIIVTQRYDSAARLARVWEQEISLPMQQYEASKLFSPLKNNYGMAGAQYIAYLVQNQAQIKELINTKEEELSRKLKGEGSDRFYISMITACIVGASIAYQLGLTNHDLQRGIKYALGQFKFLKHGAKSEQHSAEQNFSRFIQDNQPNTLIVEVDNPSTMTTVFNSENNIIHNVNSNQGIHLRYSTQSGMFYVTSNLIRRWYVDNHINFESDMKHLESLGVLVERQKRIVLTKGTKLNDGKQVWSLWFNLNKAKDIIAVPEAVVK